MTACMARCSIWKKTRSWPTMIKQGQSLSSRMLSLCCNVWTLGETEVLLWRLQVCCLNVWTDSVKELSQVSGFPLPPLLWLYCAIIVKCEYDHMFPVSCVMEHLLTLLLCLSTYSASIQNFYVMTAKLICHLNLSIDGSVSVNYEVSQND